MNPVGSFVNAMLMLSLKPYHYKPLMISWGLKLEVLAVHYDAGRKQTALWKTVTNDKAL